MLMSGRTFKSVSYSISDPRKKKSRGFTSATNPTVTLCYLKCSHVYHEAARSQINERIAYAANMDAT